MWDDKSKSFAKVDIESATRALERFKQVKKEWEADYKKAKEDYCRDNQQKTWLFGRPMTDKEILLKDVGLMSKWETVYVKIKDWVPARWYPEVYYFGGLRHQDSADRLQSLLDANPKELYLSISECQFVSKYSGES